MKRANQAGSIGVFVVVGAILVVTSLAVLYGVRQSTLSQNTSPISSDLVVSEEKKDNGPKNGQSIKASESTKQKSNDQQSGRGEARSEVKTEDVKPESSSSNNSSQQSTQTDKGLPKTGPESLVFSVLGIGILAFLTVAYQKSRYLV